VFSKSPKLIHRDDRESGLQGEGCPVVLTDEELIARARENDQRATEEFVSRYQQKAYAIAYHMCSGDREEAQDGFFKGLSKYKEIPRRFFILYLVLSHRCEYLFRWKKASSEVGTSLLALATGTKGGRIIKGSDRSTTGYGGR
jgi:hypothetical protein